jgi:hypothetical protein
MKKLKSLKIFEVKDKTTIKALSKYTFTRLKSKWEYRIRKWENERPGNPMLEWIDISSTWVLPRGLWTDS